MFVETYLEFCEKHAGKPLVQAEGMGAIHIFPDCAVSDGNFRHAEPPPTDSQEWRAIRRRYLAGTLKNLIAYYTRVRSNFATQIEFHRLGAGPAPANCEVWLKTKAEEIKELQAEHDALKEQSPANQVAQAIADDQRERRESVSELQRGLTSTPVFRSQGITRVDAFGF